MAREVMTERARRRHGRRVLRCGRPPARADRRHRDRLVGGRGIGAPAAEFEEQAVSRRAWAIAYGWVGRNLQGHSYSGAWGLFDFDTYDDIGPGASIAVCDYNHGNPGLIGGAMLANEFIRLPYQFVSAAPPGVPQWGQGAQGLHAPVLPPQHRDPGADAGDSDRRIARGSGRRR